MMRLEKCQRIKLRNDFERLRQGCAFKNAFGFFCKVKENLNNILPRFAVIVSKKIGKAHERNAVKRLFREIFRQEQQQLNPKYDYLIVARPGIIPNFYQLKEKFLNMCAINHKTFLSIAIDGTAASGKSSTAYTLAKKYRLLNVNTGDHYRTLTFFLLKNGFTTTNWQRIENCIQKFSLDTQFDGTSAHLTIDGICLQHDDLRSEWVNNNVAIFAQIPQIRQRLRAYQQDLVSLAKKFYFAGIVMEGRDIATHVLPEADVKIFLTADSEVREDRRRKEGEKDSIAQRDSFDVHSENNALIIDTTCLTLQAVVERIEQVLPSINLAPFQ
ncbi:MAG: ribonuclease P protein component [Puniceicoccales bacterium]|jgi:cytidylate kinase|nr:ribonuclease P protein component [Puniceicoccales bacterium]